MLGDGMVSFGVAVRDAVLQEREGVAEDRFVEVQRPSTFSAAEVNSRSPSALRKCTVSCSSVRVTPPSW